MRNRNITFTIILSVVASLAFLPQMQAVSPAPDGCYPNFTTAEGCDALNFLTTGAGNTAVGWRSLFLDSTGSFNTGVGGGALALNNADSNTAVGAAALLLNISGTENVAVGTDALVFNDSGNFNAANGAFALFNNTTGDYNTANGINALSANTTGSFNIAVGQFAGALVTTASNVICIGEAGADVDNSCYIGQIFGATSTNGLAVFINSGGRLGTTTSSRRFKEEIEPMEQASEALFALKPVTFRYKKEIDPAGISQFGLVAEDVEAVNPDLVVCDKEGKPYSVRYDQVNAMLLNEFLKEHNKVEDLEETVASLAATVKEQAAQIQRVSAQLEVSKPEPQVVANKP